jgi:hypothetical protein
MELDGQNPFKHRLITAIFWSEAFPLASMLKSEKALRIYGGMIDLWVGQFQRPLVKLPFR